MKKIVFAFVIAILSSVIGYSCKKSGNSYSMHATINGTQFRSSDCIAVNDVSTGGYVIYGGKIVDSTVAGFPYIIIGINSKGGTYSLSNYSACVDSGGNVPQSIYGTVTITINSTNISGTFNFIDQDSNHVNNGTFVARKL